MATTAGGLPYVEPSDLVSGWPAVSQSLAEELDSQLAAKAPLASPTFTGTVALPSTTTLNGVTLTAAAMSLVTSASFTTASAVNVNNVFTSSNAVYLIQALITAASADLTVDFKLRLSGTDAVTNYNYIRVETQQAAGPSRSSGAAAATSVLGSIPTTGAIATLTVANPAAAAATYVHSQVGNGTYMSTGAVTHTTATAYDGFSLVCQANNITGVVRVYKLVNS